MNDLIIIGGGPAGVAAAVYAARKQLNTVMIVAEFGGQSSVSPEIYNWIGTTAITGADLAKKLKEHAHEYEGDHLTIVTGQKVTNLKSIDGGFQTTTEDGTMHHAKSILIASGSGRRKLDIPGAEKFENRGVVYCASCDGPLFADQDVAVIGGGNAGFETAAQLLAYCKSVTLIHRSGEFKADEITVSKVLANDKMTSFKNSTPTAVLGDKFVTGITYKDNESGNETTLDVTGVFVEIGQIPNTHYATDMVDMTPYKQIRVDPKTQRTSQSGIWAAGDCSDGLYHQNNIAAGDAVKAIEDIYLYLHNQ